MFSRCRPEAEPTMARPTMAGTNSWTLLTPTLPPAALSPSAYPLRLSG